MGSWPCAGVGPCAATYEETAVATQEPVDKPVIVSTDEARGALGPEEVPRSATLLPMLIGSLILIVIGMIVVVLMR